MDKLIIVFIFIIIFFINKYFKFNLKIENYKDTKTIKNIYDNFTLLDLNKDKNLKIIISEKNRKYIYYVLFSETNPDIKKWEKNEIINLNSVILALVKVLIPNNFKNNNTTIQDYKIGIYKRVRFILKNYYDCSLLNLEKLASGNISMKNFLEIKRNCIINMYKKYLSLCIPSEIISDRLNLKSLVDLFVHKYYKGNYLNSYSNRQINEYNIYLFEKFNYLIVDSFKKSEIILQLTRCLINSSKKLIYKLYPNTKFYENYNDSVSSLHYFLNNEDGLKYFNYKNKLSKFIKY
jgi:hypothetical protein